MEHRALSTLIIRISGLLVIVYSVTNAVKTIVSLSIPSVAVSPPPSAWPIMVTVIVALVIPVALGLLLVYFSGTITSKILRIDGMEITGEQIKPLQQVVFSAIGLWLVLVAVIDATYFYGKTRLYLQYIQDTPSYTKMPPLLPDDFGGFVSCAVQFVIGILLLIGNRGIVNLLARLRD